MRVIIPSALRNYTHDMREVDAHGKSLVEVFDDLDAHYSGIRFRIIDEQDRIRPHIRVFINQTQAKNINEAVSPMDKILIVCALSGG